MRKSIQTFLLLSSTKLVQTEKPLSGNSTGIFFSEEPEKVVSGDNLKFFGMHAEIILKLPIAKIDPSGAPYASPMLAREETQSSRVGQNNLVTSLKTYRTSVKLFLLRPHTGENYLGIQSLYDYMGLTELYLQEIHYVNKKKNIYIYIYMLWSYYLVQVWGF